uniref:Uncharacterized protein n=1 Tax=Physcomitrium patens TaxID=3218 RepID=A0A2K1K3R5_PHYPA|nr:hypothetical protein PHYPA_012894 [Physcomitrium patens]
MWPSLRNLHQLTASKVGSSNRDGFLTGLKPLALHVADSFPFKLILFSMSELEVSPRVVSRCRREAIDSRASRC